MPPVAGTPAPSKPPAAPAVCRPGRGAGPPPGAGVPVAAVTPGQGGKHGDQRRAPSTGTGAATCWMTFCGWKPSCGPAGSRAAASRRAAARRRGRGPRSRPTPARRPPPCRAARVQAQAGPVRSQDPGPQQVSIGPASLPATAAAHRFGRGPLGQASTIRLCRHARSRLQRDNQDATARAAAPAISGHRRTGLPGWSVQAGQYRARPAA